MWQLEAEDEPPCRPLLHGGEDARRRQLMGEVAEQEVDEGAALHR